MSADKNRDLLTAGFCVFFLLSAVLWFAYEIWVEGKVPFFRDLGPYFYPIRFSLAESLKAGELPLWDRQMAMGFPLLAAFQAAPFYPPHLLLGWLPLFDAIRVLFLFHYLVAAFGSYALARKWGYSYPLSLVAAALFTFGGVTVSLINLLNHFQTAVWLPWLILTGERAIETRSWNRFLSLAGMCILQFLAGSPEIYLMSLGLLLLNAARGNVQPRGRSYPKSLLLIGGANLLLVGLAMIQLLPTLELFLQSRRPGHIPVQEATAWSLHPLSLINILFLDKEVDLNLFSGFQLFFIRDLPFFVTLYMGQISLLGFCSWLHYAARREKIVVSALLLVTIMFALGRFTPIYPFFVQHVAVFGLVRFPEKFFFLTYAILVFVVLKGLKSLLDNVQSNQKYPLGIPCLVLVLLTTVYLICRLSPGAFSTFYVWITAAPASLPSLKMFSSVIFSLERQIILLSGILLLIMFGKFNQISSGVLRTLFVLLVFVDLAAAHRPYQFPIRPGAATQGDRILSTPDVEPFRVFSSLPNLHPNVFTFKNRSFPQVVTSVFSSLVPNTGILYGFDYMQEIDALSRKPYDLFLQAARDLPPEKFYSLLGALNIKYIASFSPLPEGKIELVGQFPQHPLWLYRLHRPVPRVYVASATRQEEDPMKTLELLANKTFDPFTEVVLDRPVNFDDGTRVRSEAKILEYRSQTVTIKASLKGSGILVLTDSFYPGWRAYVNGVEEEILRANYFFRGVVLPAGEHTVEFRYEPKVFKIGAAISLSTIASLIGISILLAVRRRKTSRVASPA